MASIDIIELRKTDTGERFYPLTHVNAVVGLSDRDFFEKYTDDNGQTYSVRLKQEYTGLWADGFMSAGGLNANSGGGGGGGVENLWALSDVYHSTSVLRAGGAQSVQPGDILSYGAGPNNQQWYARPVDTTPTQNSTGLITSGAVYSAVSAINALIPSAATSSNQLADKAFVNSSIASSTGSFDGTYNLVSDLNLSTSATHSQTATALASAISSPSNNDYCFVQVPTSDSTPTVISSTDRYKYNGSSWAYEYSINNSSFTQAQWDAINSGVTTTKIGNYDTHIADSTIHVTAADKTAWDAKVSNVQADWNATTGLAAILNKPTIPDPQIQSDWSQTNTSSKDYIKNKPTTWALSNITGADDLKLIEALTGGGLLKRNANNTWSLDSSTYLTANQTITLTGDVTGSGTTSIATTIGTGKVTNAMLAGSIANNKLANSAITINGSSTSLGGSFSTASITEGTAGTSSATSGATLAVPYVTLNKYGIATGYGTHAHTINNLANSALQNSSITIGSTAVSLGGTITNLTGIGSISASGALTLTTTKKIYFGDTDHFIELDSNGFHFSHGLYSEGFVSGGGLNSGSGGGGGVEYLWALNDVKHSSGVLRADGTSVVDGDVLVYGTIATNTKGWYAAPQATGGITGITMNGSPVTVTSGVAALGTVLTSDANYVKLTGNQTIAGTKTFSDIVLSDPSEITFTTPNKGLDDYLADISVLNSDFYAPTSAGTSGQYLVSSGSGAPTWKSAGSIANNNDGLVTGGTVYSALASYQTKVSALGSVTKPVYISAAGTFSEAYKYAGGSEVNLNGASKQGTIARIYAPTSSANNTTASGTLGQILVSSGLDNAPTWRSEMFIDKTNSRVGIGTTSPSYKLHVVGNSYFNGDISILSNKYLNIGSDASLRFTNTGLQIETGASPIHITANLDPLYLVGDTVRVSGGDSLYLEASRITFSGATYTDDDFSVGVDFYANGYSYFSDNVEFSRNLYPESANSGSIGLSDSSFASLWVKRWYPNPGDSNHYIEWDSDNGAFKIVGDVYATGQVAAGGIASNS